MPQQSCSFGPDRVSRSKKQEESRQLRSVAVSCGKRTARSVLRKTFLKKATPYFAKETTYILRFSGHRIDLELQREAVVGRKKPRQALQGIYWRAISPSA
jgi:hypothetical protein